MGHPHFLIRLDMERLRGTLHESLVSLFHSLSRSPNIPTLSLSLLLAEHATPLALGVSLLANSLFLPHGGFLEHWAGASYIEGERGVKGKRRRVWIRLLALWLINAAWVLAQERVKHDREILDREAEREREEAWDLARVSGRERAMGRGSGSVRDLEDPNEARLHAVALASLRDSRVRQVLLRAWPTLKPLIMAVSLAHQLAYVSTKSPYFSLTERLLSLSLATRPPSPGATPSLPLSLARQALSLALPAFVVALNVRAWREDRRNEQGAPLVRSSFTSPAVSVSPDELDLPPPPQLSPVHAKALTVDHCPICSRALSLAPALVVTSNGIVYCQRCLESEGGGGDAGVGWGVCRVTGQDLREGDVRPIFLA